MPAMLHRSNPDGSVLPSGGFSIPAMPLPPASPARTPVHTRAVRIEVFRRDDGLWDLEAQLHDSKPHPLPLRGGVRPAGEPVHWMHLRVTIDARFSIVAVAAASDAVPYPGHCESAADGYGRLVGLNLLKNFRAGVRERLGGVAGCTHMSELAQVLPTAAVQAFAGDPMAVEAARGTFGGGDSPPFQLDRCHAMRTDGEAVRLYYPRWYRGPGGKTESVPIDFQGEDR